MMAHNQDWLEWLLSLNANAVEYVIVGGVALAHHGTAASQWTCRARACDAENTMSYQRR